MQKIVRFAIYLFRYLIKTDWLDTLFFAQKIHEADKYLLIGVLISEVIPVEFQNSALVDPDGRLFWAIVLVVKAEALDKLNLVAPDLVFRDLADALNDGGQLRRLNLRSEVRQAAHEIAIDGILAAIAPNKIKLLLA